MIVIRFSLLLNFISWWAFIISLHLHLHWNSILSRCFRKPEIFQIDLSASISMFLIGSHLISHLSFYASFMNWSFESTRFHFFVYCYLFVSVCICQFLFVFSLVSIHCYRAYQYNVCCSSTILWDSFIALLEFVILPVLTAIYRERIGRTRLGTITFMVKLWWNSCLISKILGDEVGFLHDRD